MGSSLTEAWSRGPIWQRRGDVGARLVKTQWREVRRWAVAWRRRGPDCQRRGGAGARMVVTQ